MSAVLADVCGSSDALAPSFTRGDAQNLHAHLLHSRTLTAFGAALLDAADEHDKQDDADDDAYAEEDVVGVGVAVSRFRFHRPVQHLSRGAYAVHHTLVPVRALERRHHILHLYALRHGVGHGALYAVSRGEAHLVLVHDEEDEQSVVALLLAYSPLAEQFVAKVEDVLFAYAWQHHYSRFYARALLQASEHGVDRVASCSRENSRRVSHILACIAEAHVGHVVDGVLLGLCGSSCRKDKEQGCDKKPRSLHPSPKGVV